MTLEFKQQQCKLNKCTVLKVLCISLLVGGAILIKLVSFWSVHTQPFYRHPIMLLLCTPEG